MSTSQAFVEHVVDQARLGGRLTFRKMFGEYGFHLDGKFIALACEDSLFLKETPAVQDSGLDFPMLPPYEGAKPYPVIDELLDDPDALQRLLLDTLDHLPEPKPKQPRKRKGKP